VYVHAYAEVWARRYHAIEFAIPFSYEEKFFTGQTINRFALQLLFAGNRRITLPSSGIPFNSYDRITTQRQVGVNGDYPLPFVLVREHYAEFIWEPRTRTPEEAKELAERMITGRIIRDFDFAIDIIGRQVSFAETPEALQVSALITTHERIDRQVPIPVQ
jgi:hypothetical protein